MRTHERARSVLRERKEKQGARRLMATLALSAILGGGVAAGPAMAAPSVLENLGGVTGEGFAADDKSFNGEGQIVVVIDGAFNPDHPMLAGRVIEEACFGTFNEPLVQTDSLCAADAEVRTDAGGTFRFDSRKGASRYNTDCVWNVDGYPAVCHNGHGTKVAGYAAGSTVTIDTHDVEGVLPFSGVAPGAKLILIKVGHSTGWNMDAVGAALRYVRDDLTQAYPGQIAAVNLSVSGEWTDEKGTLIGAVRDQPELHPGETPIDPEWLRWPEVADLKNKGTAVVVAAGNSGLPDGLGFVASPSAVVAVGATNVDDMSTLTAGKQATNASRRVDLLAPVGVGDGGNRVWSAHVNLSVDYGVENGYGYGDGTSFASPQVAGAFAILRERYGYTKSVDELTQLLKDKGAPVTDARPGNSGVTMKRVVLANAVDARVDPIVITSPVFNSRSFSPVTVVEGTATPNARVEIRGVMIKKVLGSGIADASGRWSVTVPDVTPTSTGKPYSYHAVQLIGGVEMGLGAVTFERLLSTAVQPIAFTSPAAGEGVTTLTPVFAGTGEPGATVTVRGAKSGTTMAIATVGADGRWSAPCTVALVSQAQAYEVRAAQTLAGARDDAVNTTFFVSAS